MGNLFLKMFSIETLILFVVAWLASTVKNPTSQAAIRARSIVRQLYNASRDFLERTGGIQ